MQGRDVKKWRWGNYLNVTIENPVVHRIPYVGKYFDIVGTPMSGGGTTVKQTTEEAGAFDAHDGGSGRLEPLADECADRTIGTDSVKPLSG